MTECPKCGVAVADGSAACSSCGIVFDKFERRVAAAVADPVPAPVPAEVLVRASADVEDEALSGVVWWGRAILLLILVWLT
ncbi:MAG: hypothetical protein Q7J25_02125 [Vicinamibacterales bacterium]|nr:hypothetical protein [Vicinamibacterales bacterium]